jgi:ubiquinone/menaquinone biosynthesis C-methylase UbiE
VLETGVGTSRNIFFYPIGLDIEGVDYSPNMLERAIEKSHGECSIRYGLQDVEKLSYADETFDTIVDTFGLEYYRNPRLALMEMQRVCKKDGHILLLNYGASESEWYNWYERWCQPYNVCKYGYFSNRRWDRLLEDMGFNVITSKRFVRGCVYYQVIKNNRSDIVISKKKAK